MLQPLVSIIIPVFNREEFIAQTLNSIIDQQYENWEAIVVDDGSENSAKKAVLEYSQKDKRIKIFERNKFPKGASACRNIGLQKAQGDYIIFLDSDDILATWCLRERVKNMQENPELDFAIFHAKTFTKNIDDGHLHTTGIVLKNQLYHFLAAHCIWQTMCPIWKKEFLLKLGGFDEDFQRFQDAEFHVRALLEKDVKYKVFSSAKHDCYYRLGYESRTKKFWNTVVENNILFIQKMTATAQHTTDTNLFKKSISIVIFFGLTYALRADIDAAETFSLFLKKIKVKDCLTSKEYKLLNFILILFKNKLLDRFIGKKAAIRFLNISAQKKIKQL